jgi:LmbE family N-acetylglucosaminyl deacetylase
VSGLLALAGGLALSTGAAAALLGMRARNLRRGIDFEPARDHAYGFLEGTCARLPVALEGDGFAWPEEAPPPPEGATALLRARVRAHPLGGRIRLPYFEIGSSGAPLARQYVDPGARGLRHLNVTPALEGIAARLAARASPGPAREGAPGAPAVSLAGRGISLAPGPAELLLFERPALEGRRLLVVAPHPDDAEIAAFGLTSGREAWVATLTAGDAAGKKLARLCPEEAARHRLMGRLRLADSIGVPMLAGVPPERALNLGYFDGTLEEMREAPERPARSLATGDESPAPFRRWNAPGLLPEPPARATWRALVEDLAALLARVRPGLVALPHPLLDTHPDHSAAALALLEALDAAPEAPGATLLLYTVHHAHAEAHPLGPRDGLVSLGPWFDERAPVGRVVSLPLSEETRLAKLFALEASHDLRPAARFDAPSAWEHLGRALRAARDVLRGRDPLGSSYTRRALRPNELFIAHEAGDAGLLREAFLERRARA